MTVFALNGLGRIGKLALKPLLERGAQIAWINDAVGDAAMHAHLLEFDTVHGRWAADFASDDQSVTIDGTRMPFIGTADLNALPLVGVDVVIDCTGKFKSEAALAPYFEAGVKKVVVSAPVKDGPTTNIVYGVNHDIYDPSLHQIVTAASCTTNCLAPVVKVVHENLGIKHGSITTIHDVTNTQTIVDRPAKDLRRARSALNSLIPTTTGSATAITLIYPELKGRLNGHAVRVPLLNASITDCVFELERNTSAEEVNALFKAASEGALKGILGYEERPLVSADYTNDTRSSIVDAPSTMVVNGTQLKVYAWYDNEMGYAHRLVDVALMVGADVSQNT
jgi:glyceraldehyde 3-phosphate dehydrogenase